VNSLFRSSETSKISSLSQQEFSQHHLVSKVLLTNHFIDGGATGISLLISALTGIPLYIFAYRHQYSFYYSWL
jgi:uncharacterized membrane-anchored protein YitT (DUF2179 family)